ncbi:MAG: SDR family NAD(P)-dependent oxidoreductase [Dehalococcoidia bacterium]
MQSYLDGQVAVVTGGGNGIGRATAQLLARKGAKVAVVDKDQEAGSATAEQIAVNEGEALFVQADVSRPQDVKSMAERVLSTFGKVDTLINNAATFPRSMLVDMSWEEWQHVIDVNLHGPFLCTKALMGQMIERRSGRIANIASGLGITGGVKAAHYATSKGGLIAFTKCLALELAPYGITANVLVPGLTDTDMPRRGQSAEEIAALVEQIPLKRLATPEEVAAFLAFLVSPACAYVTGQTICINGGWIMP